jgi:hypothetical protein
MTPHVSIAPSSTHPITPMGRSRGTTSAIKMKIVASIQYTLTAYLACPPVERGTSAARRRFTQH